MAQASRSKTTGDKSVVISIDFEMRWGVHDLYQLDLSRYRVNIENSRRIVPTTLQMLAERNLRATWATVGALGASGWDEYFAIAPPAPPYRDPRLAVRREYSSLDPSGSLHFASDLVHEIVNTKGQELGSHSFSHLYFREPGVRLEDFVADMAAVRKLWTERFGVTPVSLVFPRNQCAFEENISDTGIKIWRGPEPAWFYTRTAKLEDTIVPRALRFVDSIVPLVRRASLPDSRMVRAGIFVRFQLPESLWQLQLWKIAYELRHLEAGQVFHLWWHPHNLGCDVERSLARLARLLDLISVSCANENLVSKAMRDLIVMGENKGAQQTARCPVEDPRRSQ